MLGHAVAAAADHYVASARSRLAALQLAPHRGGGGSAVRDDHACQCCEDVMPCARPYSYLGCGGARLRASRNKKWTRVGASW